MQQKTGKPTSTSCDFYFYARSNKKRILYLSDYEQPTSTVHCTGYPFEENSHDERVPFVDLDTRQHVYLLNVSLNNENSLLRLDWNVELNLNASNAQENMQEEAQLAADFGAIQVLSTATGSFYFQGTCDPNATSPMEYGYYPNCTNANNGFLTGGVLQPTNTSHWITKASADLVPFLKPF
jgi:hypothetical protein